MSCAKPSPFHCIVCTLAKIPFTSLSKESQQRIVRNGRPTAQMPLMRARHVHIDLAEHDWMTGCDREQKLYCWPCLLFNTSEDDVWGKRGISYFYCLTSTKLNHVKEASHQAKNKTLKLWIQTVADMSDSSDEEDVECIPELNFLNESASDLEEEIDVKPKEELLNAGMSVSRDPVVPKTGQTSAESDHEMVAHNMQHDVLVTAHDVVTTPSTSPITVAESSPTSSRSSTTAKPRCNTETDCFARLHQNTPPERDVQRMSQMAPNRTEKYQLKWVSHQQNINVSLSNLYKNDRYADVMLLTCNGDENYTIPAHKLILGTSSLYFANIFDKNSVPSNAIPYIVLPPDLTYRSMQVLLQYMYTGESTVSNEILKEVLRGGEILKIHGLWRNECAKTSGTDGYVGESNVRFVSPVTVTLPAQQASHSTVQQKPSQATPLIQVNRDVAIDPARRRRATSTEGARLRTVSVQNQENSSQRFDHSTQGEGEDDSLQQRLQGTSHENRYCQRNYVDKQNPGNDNNVEKRSANVETTQEPNSLPQELCILNVKAEPVEWSDLHAGELVLPESSEAPGKTDEAAKRNGDQLDSRTEVKSEGCDDVPTDNAESSWIQSPSPSTEPLTYSPLTCELCSETFTIPGEWVRHIEGHSETAQNRPKRRRRTEEATDTDETATLRCDLCATYYFTPADWVRHIQSTHTETELAASNNRVLPGRRTKSRRSSTAAASDATTSEQEKQCTVCKKSFPSYASMAIHKRTHTGETPFHCEICNKGFNVKSNFVRHMRTLHNQQDDLESMSSQTDRESCSSD
ncbi:myoneurin-like [Anopheles ziemanni]|uniref:myoneurin-like n=1 Tax=Anopheles coustani TaxID=139045 RepID=UPI0026591267|nr:myoneurin-like [Anopheles coustani]XP_058178867.1 myoneurin-like [Anopheles ziemanni]